MTALRMAALAALPVAAFSQTEYFPLHVGNQWIYRQSGAIPGAPVVVDIPRLQMAGGREYAVLRGLEPEPLLLRMAEDGTLYRYMPREGVESVWANFSTPTGASYRTSVDPCTATAIVASREATVRVPAGEFVRGFEVRYPSANCADAGLTGEVYLPYIGLVQRTALTIAGPRTLSLAYARVGGVTVISEPEISFAVTLDRATSPEGGAVSVRMTMRATQEEPVELEFGSSQRYDIALRNARGEEVLVWSDGKAFLQVLGREQLQGERNWIEDIRLVSKDGRPLASGSYVVEAWLTTTGAKRFAASAGLEIRPGR